MQGSSRLATGPDIFINSNNNSTLKMKQPSAIPGSTEGVPMGRPEIRSKMPSIWASLGGSPRPLQQMGLPGWLLNSL